MTTAIDTSDRSAHVGALRVVGYGVGDFAFNLTFTFCSLFLLYFYTDVLGLSPTVGGMIIMVALIWEGATDPVVGILANKTRSRWGRYRPYLIWGSLPLALSFVAMFVPTGLTGTPLALYALVTHLVFRTLYTVVNIPYIALSAQMTSDSLERGKLAGARMMFAILCGLVLAGASLPLVGSLGGGTTGFFGLSIVYGAAAVAILLICFASTREDMSSLEAHPTFAEMLGAIKSNRPFLALLAATVLGSVGYTMSGKAMVYYMKYHVGSEAAVTIGLTIGLSAAALAMVPWLWFTRRTSKRTTWLTGASLTGLVSVAMFMLAPTSGPTLWILLAIAGAGNAAFILSFWSMVPDTVEYGELKTGTRAEGAVFGFMIFSQKIALGIGTGLLGVILDLIGYRANQTQTPEALQGILVLFTLVPLALSIAAAAFIWFYPIDRATHGRIVEEIADRRRARAVHPLRLPEESP